MLTPPILENRLRVLRSNLGRQARRLLAGTRQRSAPPCGLRSMFPSSVCIAPIRLRTAVSQVAFAAFKLAARTWKIEDCQGLSHEATARGWICQDRQARLSNPRVWVASSGVLIEKNWCTLSLVELGTNRPSTPPLPSTLGGPCHAGAATCL